MEIDKINKDRKICVVNLDGGYEDTLALALTEEQITLLEWLKRRGYEISVNVQNEVEII